MTDENKNEPTSIEEQAALFAEPKTGMTGEGGGAFWKPAQGVYALKFLRVSKGPVFKNKDTKTGVETDAPQIRWHFEAHKLMPRERVWYSPNPESDESDGSIKVSLTVPAGTDGAVEAEAEGLSSTTLSDNAKCKATNWLSALLRREIDYSKDTKVSLFTEAQGKWAMGVFGLNQTKKRIVLKDLSRLAE